MKCKVHQIAQVNFLLLIIALMLIAGCNNRNQNDNKGLTFNARNAGRHVMKIDEALAYTSRFKTSRANLDAALAENEYFRKNPIRLLNGEYFNRDAIIALLKQADSGGIRIYLGQDPNGTVKFILVPATEKSDIIGRLVAFQPLKIPGVGTAKAAPFQTGEVMERGGECPTMCPEDSPFTTQR
jgi:hypothetical protein